MQKRFWIERIKTQPAQEHAQQSSAPPRPDTNRLSSCGYLMTLYGIVGVQRLAGALMANVQSFGITAVARASQHSNGQTAFASQWTFPSTQAPSTVFLQIFTLGNLQNRVKSPRVDCWKDTGKKTSEKHILFSSERASPSYGAATFYSTLLLFVCKEAILRQEKSRETTVQQQLSHTNTSGWQREAVQHEKILSMRFLCSFNSWITCFQNEL